MTTSQEFFGRYNTSQVAAIFGVSIETIRLWSEEFQRHLSPTASPGKGKHRSFTAADLEVLSLVAELKNQNLNFRDIHAGLDNGQRGAVPEISHDDLRALLLRPYESQVTVDLKRIEQQLIQVQQERDRALEELLTTRAELEALTPTREENIKLKSDLEYSNTILDDLRKRLEQTEQRVNDLLDEHSKLQREAGEAYAKGVMDALRRRGDLPD